MFDLGTPFQLLSSGTADFLGSATRLLSVPAGLAGTTVHVEAASTLSGYLVDSNPVTVAIQ